MVDLGLVTNIVLGLIAIGLAIIAIRLARRKKPVWAYNTRHIIGRDAEAPPELKFIFGTEEVTDVYKTVIVFFNRGNEIITASDVAENVAIHFKNAKILKQPTIVKFSRKGNRLSAKQAIRDGDNVIEFAFKYLGHNDGAVIEVLHTESGIICHSGEIKNVEIAQLKEFIQSRPEGLYGGLAFTVLFTAMLVWMWLDIGPRGAQPPVNWWSVVFLAIFTFGYIYFVCYGLTRRLLRYMMFPPWSREKK